LLGQGPEAVLYAILDQVVDEYVPVMAGLQNDIDEIEDQLFSNDALVSRRIYELSREVIEFQRTTRPLIDILTALEGGFDKYQVDVELRRNLRDVHDHVTQIVERVDLYRALLQNALTVHATLVGQQQNDEMRSLTESSLAQNEEVKRISSWAAIFFAPTVVGAIYGMNFDYMPELHWRFGYPLALIGMVIFGAILYLVFRRKHWL
jgi:magnesium transporter